MNSVNIIGNLTREPEVRYTQSGQAVCDLGIAQSSKFKDKEETCFVSVTVWGSQAESCGKYLSKGKKVAVSGRLKFDQWEKDGRKQSKLTIVAQHVGFLSPREEAPAQDDDSEGNSDLPF